MVLSRCIEFIIIIIKLMSFGLENVLSNSIYNKNKRNKYSFPKSERFPTLKSNHTIDFYDKPAPSNNRACSFGYGSKYDFYKAADINPSPFHYAEIQKTKKNCGQTFGVSRENAVNNSYINLKQAIAIPGSKYQVKIIGSKFRSPRQCFLISKNKFDHFIQQTNNPQPGKYNTLDNITSQGSYNGKFKNSRKSVFGSQERFKSQKYNSTIGPMTYHAKQTSLAKTGAASAFQFAHSKRNTYVVEEIQKSISPGPIYYPA